MLVPNYLFKDIFKDFLDMPTLKNGIMASDVFEENDMYVMEIELPGIKKEDISVDYRDDYLIVKAKKEEQKEDKDYIKRERFYGEYQRSFYVGDIKEEEINASFDNGILKLTFPKDSPSNKIKRNIAIK